MKKQNLLEAIEAELKTQRRVKLLARLIYAWDQVPELRLGQLLMNSGAHSLFYVEDENLVKRVEKFVERQHEQ